MPALRKSVPLILALTLLGQAASLRAEVRHPGVAGRVIGDTNPLSAAHIYAYQLADLSLHKAMTDGQGDFPLPGPPGGPLQDHRPQGGVPARGDVDAHPHDRAGLPVSSSSSSPSGRPGRRRTGTTSGPFAPGCRPTCCTRSRSTRRGANTVRIAGLGSFGSTGPGSGSPSRQQLQGRDAGPDRRRPDRRRGRRPDVRRRRRAQGAARRHAGRPARALLPVEPGRHLPARRRQPRPAARARRAAWRSTWRTAPNSRLSIQSFNNRMITRGESGRDSPVDFEHYQVNWSQAWARTAAPRSPPTTPPRTTSIARPPSTRWASRTRRGPGTSRPRYTETFSDSNSLQAGLRYRERQFGLGDGDRAGRQRQGQRAAGPLERRPVQPRRPPRPAGGAHGVRPLQHALGRQPVADPPGRRGASSSAPTGSSRPPPPIASTATSRRPPTSSPPSSSSATSASRGASPATR